jgi:Flp pilus assembly pilin Flp
MEFRQITEQIAQEEQGQALGEFTLVLALVALVCVAALVAIGAAVVIPFENFLGGL